MSDQTTTLQTLKTQIKQFRDERNWKRYHGPKNASESICVEASELLELFLWKTEQEVLEEIQKDPAYKERIEEEIADILWTSINFINYLDWDISTLLEKKLQKTAHKYPAKTMH